MQYQLVKLHVFELDVICSHTHCPRDIDPKLSQPAHFDTLALDLSQIFHFFSRQAGLALLSLRVSNAVHAAR